MKRINEEQALQRAAAYCANAEHCAWEVRKKLASPELPDEAVERIIARLVKERFIDERRYAASFANDKLRFNKWGRIRIDYELKKRDIPADVRAEALEGIDAESYTAILASLLKDKRKSVKAADRREEYAKLLRFGASRGFESHEINRCLKALFRGEDYEDME